MPEGSRRVLVVEDEAVLRLFMAVVLEGDGFEVRTAANGYEALLILAVWRPGIIVLDLDMPIMDGPAFRTEQRRIPSLVDVPVLIVSAECDLERHAARLEAAGSMAKPYEIDELIRAVNHLTATKRTA